MFEPGNNANPKGRPVGSVNKTTASVKAALTEAFDGIGGVTALITWGRENPQLFYPIWSKMLPTEMQVTDLREVSKLTDDEIAERRKQMKLSA